MGAAGPTRCPGRWSSVWVAVWTMTAWLNAQLGAEGAARRVGGRRPASARAPGRQLRRLGSGRPRPLSVYAGPGWSERLRRADSIRRAVKSAHFSCTSAIVRTRPTRISRSCRTIASTIDGSCTPPSKTRQTASSQPPHGGSQSVSSEATGLDRQAELLLDLAGDRELRRLADLDHAAGQVEVALVGQLAQQHPVVGGADQHLADRALAREEGVQQRAESLRVLERGVVGQPGVDDPVGLVGDAAGDALAHQPGERRDPLGGLVVGVDVGLDAGGPALEGRLDEPADRRRPTYAAPAPAGRRSTTRAPHRGRRGSARQTRGSP